MITCIACMVSIKVHAALSLEYIREELEEREPAMIMRATAAVLVLLLLVTQSSAQPPIVDLSSTYQFNASLHERYMLYWSFNNDAQTIRFAVRVRTTGWVGFGISPNGQMPQSDVVIGWVDNGRSYFDVSLI